MTEEELFHRALEKPTLAEQLAFLDGVCAGQPELRRRVERLLRCHRHEDSFLQPATTAEGPVAERPGAVVGVYKLLAQIGEGGMGTVWMAQQTAPVKRLAALKLIKAGMDSKAVIARFEAERQALALMDHPNIAKVLDGGTTSGRPFFVMELVKGVPITRYCDAHRLTPRQRLELFVPVCQAVQHAHQKGIIHRDLKPSNVLVALYDGRPVPKVIDFGVAKAAGPTLTEKTLVTGFGAIVGTPEYMSPEQAEVNQLDIDTRSDIYSLGVLLYELLTGSTPFSRKELERAGVLEMLRVIREQEPSKPSSKLSTAEGLPTLAANRGTEPAKLAKLVRGELDWIVMKALEKDRNRRYEAANGLAMDVQRYLADEPVQACPPSVGYRLRKFARRNNAALVTTALLLLMLLAAVGAVAGAIGWAVRNRTALEQQVAQDRATRRAILGKEVGRALEDAAASYQRDKLPEALMQVRRAEGLLAGGEADAELSARVRRWREAVGFALRLEEIRLERIVPHEDKLDWAVSDRAYRKAFRDHGLDLATLTPKAVADHIRSSVLRDRLIAALDDWWLCKATGRLAGQQRLLTVVRQADTDPLRARLRAAFKRNDRGELARLAVDPQILAQQPATVHLLAVMLRSLGQVPSAVRLLEEAQQRHAGDFWINYELALDLRLLDPPRSADAVGFYRVAASLRPDNGIVHYALGLALWNDKKPTQAEAALRKAAAFLPKSAWVLTLESSVLMKQRKWEEARAALVRAVSIDPNIAWPHSNLAWVHANCPDPRFHDFPRALKHARRATELEPKSRLRWNHLGAIQYRAGMWRQALQTLQKAERMGDAPDNYHRVYLVLANWRLGNRHEALKHWVQFVPWVESAAPSLGENLPLREEISSLRVEAEGLLGEFRDLETACREILRVEPKCALARYGLADYCSRARQWARSAAAYVRALEIEEPTDLPTWLACASSLVHSGDAAGYHNLCDRMVRRFGQSRDPHQIAFLAHVCVLAPDALTDSARVVQLAEQRMALTAEIDVHKRWSAHVLGLAFYRAGQFAKAVASLEAVRQQPDLTPDFKISNWLVLAMARHRLGQDREAAAALQSARALLAKDPHELWQALSVQILLREAEALLRKQ